MRVSRWTTVAAGLFQELAAGTLYGFGSYSEHIKDTLNGSQAGVNLVGSIGQIGCYTTIFGGVFYDRFGGTATAMLGGALAVVGYALAFVATLGVGLPATTGTLSVFFFIAWHGSGYLDSASIGTSLKNFPRNKGSITGLLKSFFGLSGSVVAQVSVGLFPDAPHGVTLLLFISLFVLAVVLLTANLTRPDPIRHTKDAGLDRDGRFRLGLGYALILVLATYLSVQPSLKSGLGAGM